MDEAPDGGIEGIGSLRLLKGLVITLLVVMIVGFIVLIVALVTRLPSAPGLVLPDSLILPEGARAVAVTQAEDWIAVVTQAQELLFYDARSGVLFQKVQVARPD